MEKDQNHGTICKGNIMLKTDSVVMLLLILEAAVVSPANVMKQEDHPNEVTWQKNTGRSTGSNSWALKSSGCPQNR